MTRVVAVLTAVLAASAAACGGRQDAPPGVASPAPTIATTLYFLIEGGAAPIGVRRTIVKDAPPEQGASLRGTVKALLEGPAAEEKARGITTAIPAGTKLLSLKSRGYGGTGAVVDLSGLSSVDDPLDRARVVTQVVRTLVWSGHIERVWFLSENRPWGMGLHDGSVDDGPYDYDRLHGFWLGAGCPGTETVECDSFRALP